MKVEESDLGIGTSSPEAIEAVIKKARELYHCELHITTLKEELAKQEERRLNLQREVLPELMQTADVTRVTLGNDWELTLGDIFHSSLPSKSAIERTKDDDERYSLEQRLKEGLSWLRKHKAGDLIKNTIKFDLGRGQDKVKAQILALAKKLKLPVTHSETVHPQTLNKFLRETLANGKDIPMETFSVFSGKEASLTQPKPKKGSAHGSKKTDET